MSDTIIKAFENSRVNPFELKYVLPLASLISSDSLLCRHFKLLHSPSELAGLKEPLVCLCTPSSLEYGFARRLFSQWAGNKLNTVVGLLLGRDRSI